MAKRLVDIFVKNIAAVEHPANRRHFLVIKTGGSMKKAEHEAMTFDEAMMTRKVSKVFMMMSDHYGALMDTIHSIRESDEEDKIEAVKTAITGFVESVKKAIPSMIAEMSKSQEAAIDASSMVKLRDRLTETIKEAETMSEQQGTHKPPDATMLQKMANGFAVMFGKAFGADEKVISELEKGSDADPWKGVSPEVKSKVEKAEAANEELRKSNEDLKKQLDEVREAQELRKFAEEVALFKDIGLDPTKDAALLKSVTEKLPKEQADRIREIFKSAVEKAKVSALFEERGSVGLGMSTGSIDEQIQQRIDALVSKNDKLTPEQARDQVFRADPMLFEKWRKETSIRV